MYSSLAEGEIPRAQCAVRPTREVLYPALGGLGRLCLLHVLQRLVQEHVSRGGVRLADDLAVAEAAPAHARLLQLHAATKAQLYQDAATQARRYAVIPEGCVALHTNTCAQSHS